MKFQGNIMRTFTANFYGEKEDCIREYLTLFLRANYLGDYNVPHTTYFI